MSAPYCLTIAGFDPSGGAGLNGDIKTWDRLGIVGLSVCTSITIQSENIFNGVEWTPIDIINKQLLLLLQQYHITHIKIGLIQNQEVLDTVLTLISNNAPEAFVIWDPILKASAGFDFEHFHENELSFLKYVQLITPNESEYNLLSLSNFTGFILKTGGASSPDSLIQNKTLIHRFDTKEAKGDKHGTGCVYSAAILAFLAKGFQLNKAISMAKSYVSEYISTHHSLLGIHSKVASI